MGIFRDACIAKDRASIASFAGAGSLTRAGMVDAGMVCSSRDGYACLTCMCAPGRETFGVVA
ncbi:hypothetical protein C6P77_07920 [Burkholderia ambifaria]|nr:hypothetical protein C6P77_07920 [Burkholderia ambifaria]